MDSTNGIFNHQRFQMVSIMTKKSYRTNSCKKYYILYNTAISSHVLSKRHKIKEASVIVYYAPREEKTLFPWCVYYFSPCPG